MVFWSGVILCGRDMKNCRNRTESEKELADRNDILAFIIFVKKKKLDWFFKIIFWNYDLLKKNSRI